MAAKAATSDCTINGSMPGPTIRGQQGKKFMLSIQNDLGESCV